MINAELPEEITNSADDRIAAIMADGPSGALTLAGIATAVVMAIWFAFYLFVFLPRGALQ